jgi:GDPmannose 4,6-dehydratase
LHSLQRVPRALVTGVTGQDGSYLAELLLDNGYEVFGTVRSADATVLDGVMALRADLGEPATLRAAVHEARPDELYHLAAPTFVPKSWEEPGDTLAAIAGATATLLMCAREANPDVRVWVATSSEIFGDAGESPQNELSPMRPRSPYGVAKLAAHGLVGAVREHYGLFACSGITYNHESSRRPEQFVTRKVTRAAAAIKRGLQDVLVLGDLDAVRDWSHAKDVTRAAWLALQAEVPDDYVVASGVGRTVREFVRTAFAVVDLDSRDYVKIDQKLSRLPESIALVGDASRASERLGWEPTYSFEALVTEMVDADLAELCR